MTSIHPAAKLPDSKRQNLAVLALAGSASVIQLAVQHDVSRKLAIFAQRAGKLKIADYTTFESGLSAFSMSYCMT